MPQGMYKPESVDNALHNNFTIKYIEDSIKKGKIIHAKVILCDNDHNLIVDLKPFTGIIPHDEVLLDTDKKKEIAILSKVGKYVCFKINDISEDNVEKKKAVLSRKAAQQEALEYFKSELRIGDIIDAKVTHIEPFGVFVDIGCGIISMVGVENISVSRIPHPASRFNVGDNIKVIVCGVDRQKNRIELTHKQLLGTWEENAELFRAGETVEGIVRGIEKYGIFVELMPNLSGLAEFRDDIREGQRVCVYIKSINPAKMKIKLVIIAALSEEDETRELKYFYKNDRIDFWKYTPDCCERKYIATYFK